MVEDVVSAGNVGVNLPFDDISIHDQRDLVERLAGVGYRHYWTGEVNGNDGISPLAYLAGFSDSFLLSCAILNAYTRGPALAAMTAATLADIAPGRASIGFGAASPAIVEGWNGIPYETPYTRVKEVLRFVRDQVTDGETSREYTSFRSDGFRLSRRPAIPPALLLGAGGPRMTSLAAAEADGVVFNFVSPDDVGFLASAVQQEERTIAGSCKVYVRIFVFPDIDGVDAEMGARRMVTGYLTAPGYRSFQEWLGRSDELAEVWASWDAGERREAVKQVPDSLLSDVTILQDASGVAQKVSEFLAAGADGVSLRLLHGPKGKLGPEASVDFLESVAGHLRPAVATDL